MFNSLVITIDGTPYTFECHSYTKAMEILASHWNLWDKQNEFPLVNSFELV